MGKLITPEQAAEMLVISTRTLKDWLRSGKLKGLKIGRQWRVDEDEVKSFIETSRQK